MAITVPETQFTRDVLGRYVCNTFAEAQQSGPFDVVIVGGGTFGLALAQDLFARSKTFDGSPGTVPEDGFRPQNFRIPVLEAGPFLLAEHTQDVPNLQLFGPNPKPNLPTCPLPATRQQLVAMGRNKEAFLEVWGLPWNSTEPFGGLAYCMGGRSLYFGGWSPEYLDSEMRTAAGGAITGQTLWPQTVVDDLHVRFFAEAAEQTGVTTSNDYINGDLHDVYRKKLFGLYGTISDAVPFAQLPDYTPWAGLHLKDLLAAPPYPGFKDSLKLDAPLSVQIETRPGFFPFNKFSSPPLAITAAREAAAESAGNDARKRLMIVPNCHVKQLTTRTYTVATGATVQEIIGIDTSDGFVDLSGPINNNTNRRPVVVLAMGAIESARLALLSVGNSVPNANQIGANLMVHIRKNAQFKAPIPPGLVLKDQEITALLVRCRPTVNGTPVHFHCQITASAVPAGATGNRSDALLYQSVPDLDHVRVFAETAPGEVDVAIRAVGEMLPDPGNNIVTVPLTPADPDEYLVPRATVAVRRGPEDPGVQAAMNSVMQTLASKLFGATGTVTIGLDDLGTTFHESGTLRMGENPSGSVTNADAQFHFVFNLYAGDASVLPTCGSANPVMNGIALRRRLAKRLVPEGDGIGNPLSGRPIRKFVQPAMPPAFPPAGTIIPLFDGVTLKDWRFAGRGTFHVIDGALQSVPSFDLGLLWCTRPMPPNYRLELEFLTRMPQTNSGVFIRFTNPDAAGAYNSAWAPVTSGFEVQIDNTAAPDGFLKHKTGAVYAVNYPNDPNQNLQMPPATSGDFVNPQNANVGSWNAYKIEVKGDVISVNLNGTDTAKYTNTDPKRGRFSSTEPTLVGLQSYSNYSYTTGFRNIRITVL
jgi:hypothetical protein